MKHVSIFPLGLPLFSVFPSTSGILSVPESVDLPE